VESCFEGEETERGGEKKRNFKTVDIPRMYCQLHLIGSESVGFDAPLFEAELSHPYFLLLLDFELFCAFLKPLSRCSVHLRVTNPLMKDIK
jgi:hypothetical protein